MKRYLAIISLSTIMVCTLLVVACGSEEQTTTTAGPATTVTSLAVVTASTVPPGTGAPEGELVYAVSSLGRENFGLKQTFGLFLTGVVYESLFRTHYGDEEPGYYGQLAERYDVSEDGMTYDIYLRKGIQFHKGWGEFTADDVVFSFDQYQIPELEGEAIWYFGPPDEGGYIESYEAVDKYHFRLHLSRPYFMTVIDHTDPHMPILCKKYIESVGWEKAKAEPIGTCPYQWVETVPNNYVKFEAVDNHWHHTAKFKYLTLKLVPDVDTQLMMLKSGQADMAVVSPEKAQEATAAGLHLIMVPNQFSCSVYWGGQLLASKPTFDPTVPWADHTDEPADSEWNLRALKVRQALSLAVNSPAILEKIMYGMATPNFNRDIYPGHPLMLDKWVPYGYDPDKAKALLAEAGYAEGFEKPIEVLIPTVSVFAVDMKRITEAVANDLEAIGLKVNRRLLDPMQIDEMWRYGWDSAWRVRVGNGVCFMEPAWGWAWSKASWAFLHEGGEHPVTDTYFEQALEEFDAAKRAEIYQASFDWMYNNYVERGLFVSPTILAVGDKVRGMSRLPLQYEPQIPHRFSYEYIERAE